MRENALVDEMVDHVEQRVLGREVDVLGAVRAVALDAESGRGVVTAAIERVPDRRRVAPGIVDVADAALGGEALAEIKARAERGGGLDGRAAALAAALGEMAVARREQRAPSVQTGK